MMLSKKVRVVAFLLLFMFCIVPKAKAQDPVKGELIVQFKHGVIELPMGITSASIDQIVINSNDVINLIRKFKVSKFEKIIKNAFP